MPKLTLMLHVATECTVCTTQKSCESADEDTVDQRTVAQTLGAPGVDDLRGDTHVYCNQQGAVAAPAETNVSGTGSDSDSPDDTGSTESATDMNNTGTCTPREVDGVDILDTGLLILSRNVARNINTCLNSHLSFRTDGVRTSQNVYVFTQLCTVRL